MWEVQSGGALPILCVTDIDVYDRFWQDAGISGALPGAAAQGQVHAAQWHRGADNLAHARVGHADLQRRPRPPAAPLPDAW